MSTINERFREAREYLGLTQTQFASKANRTRSEISNIEYNKTSPKEEVINAVIKAHNINPEFLREGKLPIILPDLGEVGDTAYINELLGDLDNPFYEIIKAILKSYNEGTPAEKEALKSFSLRLKGKKESRD
jgi:transcriptional regulator with XRE-family HTH domain